MEETHKCTGIKTKKDRQEKEREAAIPNFINSLMYVDDNFGNVRT